MNFHYPKFKPREIVTIWKNLPKLPKLTSILFTWNRQILFNHFRKVVKLLKPLLPKDIITVNRHLQTIPLPWLSISMKYLRIFHSKRLSFQLKVTFMAMGFFFRFSSSSSTSIQQLIHNFTISYSAIETCRSNQLSYGIALHVILFWGGLCKSNWGKHLLAQNAYREEDINGYRLKWNWKLRQQEHKHAKKFPQLRNGRNQLLIHLK